VIALQGIVGAVRPLIERVDALTLRERLIIFSAGIALVYIAWQTLVMDPLAGRARGAEQRLAQVREQMTAIDELGTAASQDPTVKAALRNDALAQRLSALDGELS
jgi:type II secretory pathway component PulM